MTSRNLKKNSDYETAKQGGESSGGSWGVQHGARKVGHRRKGCNVVFAFKKRGDSRPGRGKTCGRGELAGKEETFYAKNALVDGKTGR